MIGHVDSVTRRKVKGWAFNPDDPHVPPKLRCLCNGEFISIIVANSYRPDLEQAGIGTGYHGFELEWDIALDPVKRHVISLIDEASGQELKNSPHMLEAENCFDEEFKNGLSGLLRSIESREGQEQAAGFLLDQAEQLAQRMVETDSLCREDDFLDRLPVEKIRPFTGCRVLVLDEVVPAKNRDAGSNAIVSHIESLQRLGMEVSFAAVQYEAAPDLLTGIGVHLYGPPLFRSIEDVLRRNVGQFDAVYIHRTSMAIRYIPLIRYWNPHAVIVYLVADLHAVRMMRQAEMTQDEPLWQDAFRMQKAELAAAWQVDTVITHSSYERDLLRTHMPAANVHVIPWAVDVDSVSATFYQRQGIAFIGNYKHAPNRDAAEYLINEVMPQIWAIDPTIDCRIYGTGLPKHLVGVRHGRVHFIGPVPDLRDVFMTARLTVAPLRYGAGLKGKVLDSFAAGIPCVCTPIAAEGMDLPLSMNALLAGDTQSLVKVILDLHNDPELYTKISERCLSYIQKNCSRDRIDALIKAAFVSAGLQENDL
ncbi:glycosyltransferase [Granulibacter bethesdensis]|uniref:glycosyltransferase n=1 Tax=Granulibacter bethesdensis TaxID=364410 RepID=UPI0003F1FE7B|nr:glycosyltransferase [Granulibacter bethesdensis]AHJ64601.1 Glycosyltransferase [Granulibacter bethesdensis CGDNIH4]